MRALAIFEEGLGGWIGDGLETGGAQHATERAADAFIVVDDGDVIGGFVAHNRDESGIRMVMGSTAL